MIERLRVSREVPLEALHRRFKPQAVRQGCLVVVEAKEETCQLTSHEVLYPQGSSAQGAQASSSSPFNEGRVRERRTIVTRAK